MKIGVSTYSFNSYVKATGADIFAVCDKVKELGFDYIEFVTLPGNDQINLAKSLKEHCADIGLEIYSYVVGANFLADDILEEVKKVKFQIDVAKNLGAKVFRHDVCYALKKEPFYDYKKAIVDMTPYIKEVSLYAKNYGIKTCTENHGFIFQAPNRMEELILSVNEDNYGWLLDIGNFLCDDVPPEYGSKIASKYTCLMHAKDFLFKSGDAPMPNGYNITTNGGNYIRGTVIGHGVVPVFKCINILKKAGYDGCITIEFEGPEDNIYALENSLKYLKNII